MIVVIEFCEISLSFVFLPFFLGRKPSKIKASLESPLKTRAGIRAVGPGKHVI